MKSKIKMIKQTDDTCGEACIAMVSGSKLDDVVDYLDVQLKGLADQDFYRGLKKFGVKFNLVKKFKWYLPRTAILMYESDTDKNSNWAHAVVLHDGYVYDPAIGVRIEADDYYSGVTSHRKLKEFIEIL